MNVDLEALTPAQYCLLPDYIRANIPDEVRTRLWLDLDRAWLDAVTTTAEKFRATHPSDPDTNLAFSRRMVTYRSKDRT